MGALIFIGVVFIMWFMAGWCFKKAGYMDEDEEILRNHRNRKF